MGTHAPGRVMSMIKQQAAMLTHHQWAQVCIGLRMFSLTNQIDFHSVAICPSTFVCSLHMLPAGVVPSVAMTVQDGMRIPPFNAPAEALLQSNNSAARKGAGRKGSIHTGTASDEELAELVLNQPGDRRWNAVLQASCKAMGCMGRQPAVLIVDTLLASGIGWIWRSLRWLLRANRALAKRNVRNSASDVMLFDADTDLEVNLRVQQLPEAPPAPVADLEYVSDDEQAASLLCAMPDRVRSTDRCLKSMRSGAISYICSSSVQCS